MDIAGASAIGSDYAGAYTAPTNGEIIEGNVGIGTTAPGQKLSVVGGNIGVDAGYGLVWTGDVNRIMTPEDNVSGALIKTPGQLRIFTGSASEKVRIDGSGNVGIGTTAPGTKLQVNGTITMDPFSVGRYPQAGTMLINGGSYGDTTDSGRLIISGGSGNNSTHSGYFMRVQNTAGVGAPSPYLAIGAAMTDTGTSFTDGSEFMRILANGNVGIGTTNPHQLLQVGNNWSGTSANSGSSVLVNASGGTQDVIPTMSIAGSASSNTGAYITAIGLDIHNDVAGTTGTRVPALTFSERGATGSSYTPTLAGIDAIDLGAGTDINWRAGGLAFSTANSAGSYGMTEKMRILNNGNVGIGTTGPGSILTVVDSTNANQYSGIASFSANNLTQGVSIGWDGISEIGSNGNNSLHLNSQPGGGLQLQDVSGGNTLINPGSGNVGIGTTGPLSKLDVAGGVAIGSYAGSNAAPSNSLIVSGNVGIGTTAPSYPLHIVLDQNTPTYGVVSNSNAGVSAASSFAAYNGTSWMRMEIGGTGYSGTGARQANAGDLIADSAASGGLSIATAAAAPIRFYTSGTAAANERMRIDTAGNVGIGTTAPLTPLHVAGEIRSQISADTTIPNRGIEIIPGSYSGSNIIQAWNNSGGTLTLASGNTGSGTLVNKLIMDPSTGYTSIIGGNVGIGTTSPDQKLTVNGTVHVYGTPEPFVSSIMENTTAGYSVYQQFKNNAGSATFGQQGSPGNEIVTGTGGLAYSTAISSPSGQAIQFAPSGNAAMTILSSGNVGIGTTNPTEKLTVNGSIAYNAGRADNLVQDPQFANTSANWSYSGGTVTFPYQTLPDGTLTKVAHTVTADPGGGTGATTFTMTPSIAINPSKTYRVSVWIKSETAGATKYLGLNTFNSSGSEVGVKNNSGVDVTNPYFYCSSSPVNVWVKYTTYIYGSDLPNGWTDPADANAGCNFGPTGRFDSTASSMEIRFYNYSYSAGQQTVDFAEPTIEEVNEETPVKQISNNAYIGENLGIGTASADEPLSVIGNIDISPSSLLGSGSTYIGSGGSASNATFQLYSGSTGFTNLNNQGYGINLQTAGVSRLTVSNGGNVGIGTTSPQARLSVLAPFGGVTPAAYIEEGEYNQVGLQVKNTNSYAAANPSTNLLQLDNANGSVMVVQSSGNVGIGTAGPAGKLEVAQTANTSNGGIMVSGSGDNVAMQIGNTGTGGAGWWLDSTGGASGFGQGKLVFGIAASGRDSNFTTPLVTYQSNGNVGIGTTNPSTVFEVHSGTNNNIRFLPNSSLVTGDTGLGIQSINDANNAAAELVLQGTPLVLSGSGNNDLVVNSTGYVGIGTTNPATTLDVAGNINLASGYNLTWGGAFGAGIPTIASSVTGIYAYPAGSTSGIEFSILSGGNVGIDTSTPAQPLEVAGQSSLPANFGTLESGAARFTSGNTGGVTSVLDIGSFNSTGAGWIQATDRTNLATHYNLLLNPNGGNVGIGVTAPNNPLEIDSSLSGGNGINIFNSNTSGAAQISFHSINTGDGPAGGATLSYSNVAGPYANALVIMNTYSAPIILGTNNTNRFAIDNNGDVGVANLAAATSQTLCYNTIVNPGYNTIGTCSSDERVKTNITPLSDNTGLSVINALNPVSFNWNPEFSNDQSEQYGFLAQQIEKVLPSLVSTSSPTALTPDGTLSLNYNGLFAPIVKSIQELDADLSSTTQAVFALQTEVAGIENVLSSNYSTSSASVSTTTVSNVVTNWFSSLGVAIENGVFHFGNLIADTLTATTEVVNTVNAETVNAATIDVASLSVGSTSSQESAGITIIDRATGNPYCIFVNNGVMQDVLGACGTFPTGNQNNNNSGNSSSGNSGNNPTDGNGGTDTSTSTPSTDTSTSTPSSDVSTSTPSTDVSTSTPSTDTSTSTPSTDTTDASSTDATSTSP